MVTTRQLPRKTSVPPVHKKRTKVKVQKEKEIKDTSPNASLRTITIEACKQWGAFKTRANKVVKAVGKKANVEINKVKPGECRDFNIVTRLRDTVALISSNLHQFRQRKFCDKDWWLWWTYCWAPRNETSISAVESAGYGWHIWKDYCTHFGKLET